MGALGALLGRCWALLGVLGALLGALGLSWAHLGHFFVVWGSIWSRFFMDFNVVFCDFLVSSSKNVIL